MWDVGHQAYPHKVLTGRRELLHPSNRMAASPRSRPDPKVSTTPSAWATRVPRLSAALGMAVAAARRGEERRAVAIIGDGALTAGMAFEALNHVGSLPADLFDHPERQRHVDFGDVGALSNYLAGPLSSKRMCRTCVRAGEGACAQDADRPDAGARLAGTFDAAWCAPTRCSTRWGCNYIGPIDGHDSGPLVTTLGNLRELRGPQLLHVVTPKARDMDRPKRIRSSGTVRAPSIRVPA